MPLLLSNIGEVLIKKGIITHNQLEDLMIKRQGDVQSIEELLIETELVTEDELYQLLSQHFNIPYIKKLSTVNFSDKLLKSISPMLARRYMAIPLYEEDSKIVIATPYYRDIETIDNLRYIFNAEITPALTSVREIKTVLKEYYGVDSSSSVGSIIDSLTQDEKHLPSHQEEVELKRQASEAPIIRLVDSIIEEAIIEGASDIHLEPAKERLYLRYRIDGVLQERSSPPKRYQDAIISRIKIMADLDITERRLPQDGSVNLKSANRNVDLRISIMPTLFGEGVVLRILDQKKVLLELTQLGFSEETCREVEQLITARSGIILVVGPTGSGKTTTLYSAISRLNTVQVKILTIEDPIEYQLEGINQIQVNPKIGLTFTTGLRSIVRHDPEIIMIGEIRDEETARIAIQSALTGHLVFSTLHTNDSASTITRLLNMGIEPYLISSSVIAILAQRLIRLTCSACKKAIALPHGDFELFGIPPDTTLYAGTGCAACHNTGYSGRTALFELLIITEPIRAIISQRASTNMIKELATKQDTFISLMNGGIRRVINGDTTLDEVLRVIS